MGSYNLFAYCSNNPGKYVDPSGHSIIGAILVIGVASLILTGCTSKGTTDALPPSTGSGPNPMPLQPIPEPNITPTCVSSKCVDFITGYEKYEPYPYDDGYGNLTIGYGHLIKLGESFEYLSESEAKLLFRADLAYFENLVTSSANSAGIVLNQRQYDAFVSLTYNAGGNGLDKVMSAIQNGVAVEDAFMLVIRSNGQVSQGLVKRRMAEARSYSYGIYD